MDSEPLAIAPDGNKDISKYEEVTPDEQSVMMADH
jgi:hypothetical protein